MKFLELRVSNVHFFKKVKFEFDYKGITAILGLNRDSKTEGVNTNGSGKSSLFSTLIDVLTPEGTSISRKDKVRQGKVEFDFEQGKHKYTVVNSFGKSEKLDIICDGASLGIHTLPDAKKRLSSITKKTLTDYRVLDYLDVRVPHPLQLGSSTQRKDFFTKFFSLASKDHVRRLVKTELDEIRAKELLLKELQSNLRTLKAEYTALPKASMTDDQYADKISKLEAQIKTLEKTSQYNDWCNTYKEDLEAWRKWRKYSLADLNEKIAQYESDIQVQESYERKLSKYRAYTDALAAYNSSFSKWKDFDVSEVEAKLSLLIAKQTKVDNVVFENEQLLKKYERQKEKLEDQIEDLESRLGKMRTTCPTCGTKLTNKQEARAHLEKELEEARSKLSLQKKPKVSNPEGYSEAIAKCKSSIDTFARLPKKPTEVAKPVKPTFEYDPEQKLERVQEVLKLAKRFAEDPRAERYYLKGLDKEDDRLEGLKTNLYDLVREQQNAQSTKERAAHIKEQASALSKRIDTLKADIGEKEVLEILTKAYGTRSGYKELVIKSICEHLQKTVNKYATFIFPEPFTFTFDLSSTNFSIIVSRPYKGKVVTSDVRKLSGAESSMFNMTLALSLLTFVPKALRSNILILDEIDANFSEEMERSLARFLPVLNKVIPHIILITPDSSKVYEGARYFTMVKQNGVSTLQPGKVLV